MATLTVITIMGKDTMGGIVVRIKRRIIIQRNKPNEKDKR
jgi:hypothetical protein